jgi:hypothetical protein
MKISNKIKKIYRWMDENPNFKNSELYKAFPGRKNGALRMIKTNHKRLIKEGIWPEYKKGMGTSFVKSTQLKEQIYIESIDSVQSDNESNFTSATTSTELDETIKNDLDKQSPDESSKINHPKDESITTSIDAFINELYEKKELIMKILNEYQKSGSLPLEEIKIEKPFKTVSFNLMEKTIFDFTEVCKRLKTSQRKAIHRALSDYISKNVIL